MKKFLVLLALLAVACNQPAETRQSLSSGYVKIGGVEYKVEIAGDRASWALGLSGRPALNEDRGMLFVFDSVAKHTFWMKDMQFPLDIIWIYNDKIVDIRKDAPTTFGGLPPSYAPKEAANYVLEVNAGQAAKNDWEIGDIVKIEFPQ